MKKVLAVVIAVAFISIGAVSSDAQVPNVQIYFDANLTATQGTCAGMGALGTLYVAGNNFNAWVSTFEFGVDFGPNWPLIYLGDVVEAGALALGSTYDPIPGVLLPANPPSGITITYPLPKNGWNPVLILTINVLWQCDDCDLDGALQPIVVIPHESTGNLEAVEFQTFAKIPAVGMLALVCPGIISTEESTWGQVKALYN